MKLDTTWLTTYINQQKRPEKTAWIYQFTNGTSEIANYRQDICLALLNECEQYRLFPLWNHDLAILLVPDLKKQVKDIILLPIVGSNSSFDAELIQYEGTIYLLLDLLNIADYTQSLKEMAYILHNLCHIAIYEYLFSSQYQATSYLEKLEMRFFANGWVQYLSWNKHHEQYVFQNTDYQKKKQRAFTLLSSALAIPKEDQDMQDKILKQLSQVDLWNRFPDIAGMFYLDKLFHSQGDQGLLAYYQKGPEGIFNDFFQINK